MSRYQGLKFKNLLTVFLICGAFLFVSQANALNNYAKEYNGTLTAAEWNGLFSDFVNTMLPVRMNGPLGINTAAPTNPIFLDVNGTVQASAFLGPITGTISAANVSSGAFGGNTGGGNYSFPGNVGIGTTNPTAKLYINSGGGSNSGVVIRSDGSTGGYASLDYVNKNNVRLQTGLYDSGDAFFYMSSAGNKIGFYTNDLQRMTIAKDGNVGIGTSNPAARLSVSGLVTGGAPLVAAQFFNTAAYSSGSGQAPARIEIGRSQLHGYIEAGSDSDNNSASGYLAFGNRQGSNSIVEVMRIHQSGNIGIGTTAPAQKLDVNGISVFRGDVHIADNGSTSKFKLSDESTFRKIQTYGSVPLSINPEGNYVGIGTTTPATILDVNGLIKMRTATILSSEDVVNKGYLDSALASTTSGIITQVATSSFWQGSLTGSIYNANTGNVGIGTTNPGEKLVVSGNNIITGRLRVNDTSLGDGALSVMQGANTWGIRLSRLEANGDPSIFFTDDVDNTFLISKPAGTNSLYLSGNVGIGTTNPSQKLHVNGKIYSDSVFVSRFGLSSSELYNTAQTKQIYGLYGGVTSGVDDTFGNLYGIGYAYSTLGGAAFSNQHNIVFTSSGVVKATIGTNNGDLDLKGNSLIAGNVGIGTTAPNDKLSIGLGGAAAPAGSDSTGHNYTNTYLSTDDYALTNYGLVKTLIAGGSGSSVGYWTMSGTNIYNSNSGNVGIGKTNPQFKLDVNLGVVNTNSNIGYNVFADAGANVGYSGYNLQLNNSSANASGYVRLARTAGTTYLGMEIASQSRDGIRFLTHATAPVEAMRINDSGLVGIGITSPQSPLHVYRAGTSEVLRVEASGTSGWIDFRENGTNRGYLGFGDSGQIFSGAATDSLSLRATGSLHLGGGGNSLQMTLNGSNVGIGTTGPTQKLDVSGNIKFASSLISTDLGLTGGGNKAFQIRGAGDGSFYASGIAFDTFYFNGSSYIYDEKIRITSSGNVGIGTTAPNDKLSIGLGGAAAPAGSDSTGHNYTNTYLSTDDYALTNYGLVKTLIAGGSGSSVGYWTMSGTNIYNSNSGNVGIGTTTPSSKLTVDGDIALLGSAPNIRTATSDAALTIGTFTGSSASLTLRGAHHVALQTYSGGAFNDRLYITSAGNVGIGTTNPVQRLEVGGNVLFNNSALNVYLRGNSVGDPAISFSRFPGSDLTLGAKIQYVMRSASVQESGALAFWTNPNTVAGTDLTERMRIDSAGNVGIGTTNPINKLTIGTTVDNSTTSSANISFVYTPSINFINSITNVFSSSPGVHSMNFNTMYSGIAKTPLSLLGNGNAIFNAGNVGIGTTAPNDKLSIGLGGSVAPAGSDSTGHNYANTYLSTDDYALANYGLVKTLIAGGSGSSVGYWTMSGTNIYNSNSGNVGIGTNNPIAMLDITKLLTQGTTQDMLSFKHDGSWGLRLVQNFSASGNMQYDWIQKESGVDKNVMSFQHGNVGIGTTNPTQKLLVNDGNIHINTPNSSLAGNGLRLNRPGATYAGFEIATNNVVDWSIGANSSGFGIYEYGQAASTRLIIKEGGNVGIGITNPNVKLEVNSEVSVGVGNSGPQARFWGGGSVNSDYRSGQIVLGRNNNTDASLSWNNLDGKFYIENRWNNDLGDILFRTKTSGTPVNALIIKAVGNIGIGTTAPNDKLSIGLAGNAAPAGSDSTGHNYTNTYLSTDDYALANYGLVKTLIAGGSGSSVGYWTMSGTNIYNSNSGNVGIGTTTPAAKLDVNGHALFRQAASFYSPQSGQTDRRLTINTNTADLTTIYNYDEGGVTFHPIQIGSSAAGTGLTVLGTGNVGIGKINPATALDVNGTVTALAFSGPLSGTISSQNVSAGEFGKNTGGGNFIFGATVAGNVGIGTTNPQDKMDVSGAIRITANSTFSSGAGPRIYRDAALGLALQGYAGSTHNFAIFTPTGARLIESPVGTNNIILGFGGGNVGIGTTDPGAYRLKVVGDVAITGALLTQTGSDFAEEFKAPQALEAGTVVIMGDEGYKSVKACYKGYDKTVVGIVSDNPSIIAGRTDIDNKNPEKVIVAMMGVVSVNVSDINGSVEKGDLLVSSGIPGYAMKSVINRPGTVIGKALENLTGKTGKIKVLVNLQ